MFNVRPNNFTPGFRVGFDGGDLGFNIAEPYSFHEVAPSPSLNFDLAANLYWRFGDGGLQPPVAVTTSEELCRGIGRSGPLCLYMCADGKMIYTPDYPTGPCPPFRLRGHGSLPWGQ